MHSTLGAYFFISERQIPTLTHPHYNHVKRLKLKKYLRYKVCVKRSFYIFAVLFSKELFAKVAQLVEHDLAKVGVAGSNPVFRSSESHHSE